PCVAMKDIFLLLDYLFKKYALRNALDVLELKFSYKDIVQDLGYKSGPLRATLRYVITLLVDHERGTTWSYSDLLRLLEYVRTIQMPTPAYRTSTGRISRGDSLR
ncbi:Uncharacterized protein FKW44_021557, partial [Caligus rogercresseyi]